MATLSKKSFIDECKVQFDVDESSIIYLMCERLNIDETALYMTINEPIDENIAMQIKEDLMMIEDAYPIQYVLGYAYFYGDRYIVNKDVLIPRFDTELLVDWVLTEHSNESKQIVDVGTGSGIIAIQLKRERPLFNVTATDISIQALDVASANASHYDVDIDFKHANGLEGVPSFDILISNPPYIMHDEIDVMTESTIKYEPDLALFAEDNGLSIYRMILTQACRQNKHQFICYFEFGYKHQDLLTELFNQFDRVTGYEFRKDLQGHDRMAKVYVKAR